MVCKVLDETKPFLKYASCSSLSQLPAPSIPSSCPILLPSTDFSCINYFMAPSLTAVVAAVCHAILWFIELVSIVQGRFLNQASGPRNTTQPNIPLPSKRRPPLLHYLHSIKDLIRCSDCLMGAFKSEKGLPRDYSGVSPHPLTLLGWRRMNSGRLAEH